MRSPRQWVKDELDNKDGMNIALAVLVAAQGWGSNDPSARMLGTVAALAILRGKL